jgi:hypothetical protein
VAEVVECLPSNSSLSTAKKPKTATKKRKLEPKVPDDVVINVQYNKLMIIVGIS